MLATVGARMSFHPPTNLTLEMADLNLLVEDIELQPAIDILSDQFDLQASNILAGFYYDPEKRLY